MNPVRTALALPALALALAACQVNVDENTAARIENAADRIESTAENAAAKAETAAEGAAATVENAAEGLGNVDVDVGVRTDGNEAAANKQ